MAAPDIAIANGFDRFHLMTAAAEVERHGRLACCFAGFYPSATWRARLDGLGLTRHPRINRLLDRAVALPDQRVRSWPATEAGGLIGSALLGQRAMLAARHAYARRVAAALPGSGARLFHYRSGFGHRAVRAAQAAGMVTLCDHSIAFPGTLEHLVRHGGRLPPPGQRPPRDTLWADVQQDFSGADAILVCSEFVRTTFVEQGWDPAQIEVAYLGIDDGFLAILDQLPARQPAPPGPLRLLFAGAIGQRKGIDSLVAALAGLDDLDWTLDLVGACDAEMAARHGRFFADPRVRQHGVLCRRDLARQLLAADLFLFPSLAEGSARVIFEALACGCYVVTTPNAGSIVQDQVHGALVPPGEAGAIQAALRAAAADRTRLAVIGAQNAVTVRWEWRQQHYGERLIAVYDRLLALPRRAATPLRAA